MPLTPEQPARQEIDSQLAECGWLIQDHSAINIAAGPGVAVREFPLESGFADYLLYVDAKAVDGGEKVERPAAGFRSAVVLG